MAVPLPPSLYSLAPTLNVRLKNAGTSSVRVLLHAPLPFRLRSKVLPTLPPSALPVSSVALLPKPRKPLVLASAAVSQLVLPSVLPSKPPLKSRKPRSNVSKPASPFSQLKVALGANTLKPVLAVLPLAA